MPDLLYAEVVHALARYCRTGRLSLRAAGIAIDYLASLPLDATPCSELAADALAIAVDRGVSGYDAMYLALAEATGSVLVTADRRLAAASANAELLS